MAVVQIAVLLVAGVAAQDGSWERQCNMKCDAFGGHPGWDTVAEARSGCAMRKDCLGFVDHTANQGRLGMCLESSGFTVGTDHHEVFRRVCVERKSAALLQNDAAMLQESSTRATKTENMQWEQIGDKICDSQDFRDTLAEAKAACASKSDCRAVVDHSATKGFFGLCTGPAEYKKASSVFKGWKDLAVHLKPETA